MKTMMAWDTVSTQAIIQSSALRERYLMDLVKKHAQILGEWPIVRYYYHRQWGRREDGSWYWMGQFVFNSYTSGKWRQYEVKHEDEQS